MLSCYLLMAGERSYLVTQRLFCEQHEKKLVIYQKSAAIDWMRYTDILCIFHPGLGKLEVCVWRKTFVPWIRRRYEGSGLQRPAGHTVLPFKSSRMCFPKYKRAIKCANTILPAFRRHYAAITARPGSATAEILFPRDVGLCRNALDKYPALMTIAVQYLVLWLIVTRENIPEIDIRIYEMVGVESDQQGRGCQPARGYPINILIYHHRHTGHSAVVTGN